MNRFGQPLDIQTIANIIERLAIAYGNLEAIYLLEAKDYDRCIDNDVLLILADNQPVDHNLLVKGQLALTSVGASILVHACTAKQLDTLAQESGSMPYLIKHNGRLIYSQATGLWKNMSILLE